MADVTFAAALAALRAECGEPTTSATTPHCDALACKVATAEVREAERGLARRWLDGMVARTGWGPTLDAHLSTGHLAWDAARTGPIDWTAPVEGWRLW